MLEVSSFFATNPTPVIEDITLSERRSKIVNAINQATQTYILNTNSEEQGKQAVAHLAEYALRYQTYRSKPVSRDSALSLIKYWSSMVSFSRLINNTFPRFPESVINEFFLGDGLCTGIVIDYISRFYQNRDKNPLNASPFPLKEKCDSGSLQFYSFDITTEALQNKTQPSRFLQASYGLASELKRKTSLEYLPNGVLNKKDIKIVDKFPSFASERLDFPMQDLLIQLKELSESKHQTSFLLGLGGRTPHHAFALNIRPPYHFVDPIGGIAIANNLEDLVLFLACYLNENYPEYHKFALLEIMIHLSKASIIDLLTSIDSEYPQSD